MNYNEMTNVLEELKRLMEEANLGPCAVHPAIARIDEMTEDGPDPVLGLAFPHDRRTEDQTFAIGKLFCRMHTHLPALLRIAEAAKDRRTAANVGDQVNYNRASKELDEALASIATPSLKGQTP